jgi:hypothetical protein
MPFRGLPFTVTSPAKSGPVQSLSFSVHLNRQLRSIGSALPPSFASGWPGPQQKIVGAAYGLWDSELQALCTHLNTFARSLSIPDPAILKFYY